MFFSMNMHVHFLAIFFYNQNSNFNFNAVLFILSYQGKNITLIADNVTFIMSNDSLDICRTNVYFRAVDCWTGGCCWILELGMSLSSNSIQHRGTVQT